MPLAKLVKALKLQNSKQQEEEIRLLECIALLSDYETAEAAKELYRPEKHAYSYDGYLYQLEKLCNVMEAGIESEIALTAVDSCLNAKDIVDKYSQSRLTVINIGAERTCN